jgi:ABC-type antimicrobial peptide transport system permease subunit
MFATYLRRELRQRIRQTAAISLGLALGIGTVITVTAVSAGLRDAQDTVLRTLSGVGSELTVTQAPSRGSPSPFPSPSPSRSPSRSAGDDGQDRLFSRQLGPLPASSVVSISRLPGVTSAAGGLSLTDLQVSGLTAPTSAATPAGRPRPSTRPSPLETRMFQVSGVDLARPKIGPLATMTVSAGRTLAAADADADVAVLDSAYAKQRGLTAGETITVAGRALQVIGIGSQPDGSPAADVYLPLQRAQSLAGMASQVNVVYVAAVSAAEVDRVRRAISELLPAATVTTSGDVADAISGSLATASSLADDLGRWLAIAVLAAAFGMASLLTVAAVSRRVREFGTLKALGWPSRRIIGQVMGEATVMGVIGAGIGVTLGYGGAALVTTLAPSLTASAGQTGASAVQGPAGRSAVGATANAGESVVVQLSAPVAPSVIVLAVALAVAGGMIAGSFGGWRAARLRPAAALAQVA